jgi:hypothetical protein
MLFPRASRITARGGVLLRSSQRFLSFKNAGFRTRSEMKANWLFAALLGTISGESSPFIKN